MIEIVDLKNWKKKKEILNELLEKDILIDERALRHEFEKNNENFINDLTDVYIVHSEKGYKATKEEEEILRSARDLRKRAIDMLVKWSKVNKALGRKGNLKIQINEENMFFVEE